MLMYLYSKYLLNILCTGMHTAHSFDIHRSYVNPVNNEIMITIFEHQILYTPFKRKYGFLDLEAKKLVIMFEHNL